MSGPGLYIPDGLSEGPIAGVPTAITGFVGRAPKGPVHTATTVTSWAEYESTFGGLSRRGRLGHSVQDYFRHGGDTAVIVRIARSAIIGHGFRAQSKGLYALDQTERVNLLVIPPYDPVHGVEPDVRSAAIAYAAERWAFVLLDAPPSWVEAESALEGMDDLPTSPDAAVYFPHLLRPDPVHGGQEAAFGPSGAVAGLMARLDAERGVWKAPAGDEAQLVQVSGLSVHVSASDLGDPRWSGVNAIREFVGKGPVVWGARTRLPDDNEWRYVPMRRLYLYLAASLSEGTRWASFEPPAPTTWQRVRAQVERFLTDLWRAGGLQGIKPEDAFYVRCGLGTTMTQQDVDEGRMVLEVGFAGVRPAEFLIVRLSQDVVGAP